MNINEIPWIKRSRLNEDVGFAGNDGFTFAVSNNTKDSSAATHKKGGRGTMEASKKIFRFPTKQEIMAAFEGKDSEPSDYQLCAVTAFASIMNTFGFTYRVPRSKKTHITHSSIVQAEKKSASLRNIFAQYNENDPIEIFYSDLQNSKDKIESNYEGVNIANILHGVRNWSDVNGMEKLMPRVAAEVRANIGSDADVIASNTYNSVLNGVANGNFMDDHKKIGAAQKKSDYEPSQKEIDLSKKIYRDLYELFGKLASEGVKPQTWVRRIDRADTFNSIMNEELMAGFRPEAYNFKGTIGQYRDKILAYLKSVAKPGEAMHSKTVIDNEVQESLTELAEKMKRLGFKDGFNIKNWFEYLKEYDDSTLSFAARRYGLSEDDFNTKKFPDFESFMRYFYEPERLYDIFESLNIKFRARKAGETRKGASLAVNARDTKRKLDVAQRQAEKEKKKSGKVSSSTEDKIMKLKRSGAEIIKKASKRADTEDGADLKIFNKLQDEILSKGEEEYITSTFIVQTLDGKIARFIEKSLEEELKSVEPHVNVTPYVPNDPEWNDQVIEIALDYPRSSKLYKIFKKNPKFMFGIMDWLKAQISKKLGKNVQFVKDQDEIHLNMSAEEAMNRAIDPEEAMSEWERILASK